MDEEELSLEELEKMLGDLIGDLLPDKDIDALKTD